MNVPSTHSARWERRTEYVRGFREALDADTEEVTNEILNNIDLLNKVEVELSEAGIEIPSMK